MHLMTKTFEALNFINQLSANFMNILIFVSSDTNLLISLLVMIIFLRLCFHSQYPLKALEILGSA